MDKNLDTRISVEEYRGATLAAFQSMDKNRDGKIGGVELSEVEPAPSDKSPLSSAQIGELDVNKDSQLTSTELLNGASRLFKNLDIDGNSFLSAEELSGRQYRSKGEPDVDSGKSETRVQPDK